MNLFAITNAISAVCPIDGVSSDGRIDFAAGATDAQKAAAQAVLASWVDPPPPTFVRTVTGTQFFAALRDLGIWSLMDAAAAATKKPLDAYYYNKFSPHDILRVDNPKMNRIVALAATLAPSQNPPISPAPTMTAIFNQAVTE